MSMGHVVANDPTHVCDNCEGTYTGLWYEAQVIGWTRREQVRTTFVMCDGCEKHFAERRRTLRALNAAIST